MRIFRRILGTLGVAVLLVAVYMAVRFMIWKDNRVEELVAGSQVIDTAAGPMEYRLWGEGGTVMLFVHGTPGGYDQYFPLQSREAAPLTVLAVSRPGYLRTPIETGRSPEEQADAYAALLDSLGITEVIVLAASGGGPSGITFAAKYPDRTLGLITMAAVSQPMEINTDESPPAIARLLQNDFMNWMTLGLLADDDERLVSMVVSGEDNRRRILDDPAKVASLRRAVLTSQPPSLRQTGVDNDAAHLPVIDLPIDDLRVPVLITHGTADRNVPFAFSETLSRRVPHAEFAVLEGADHFMRFSHSEEYDALLDRFVASLTE